MRMRAHKLVLFKISTKKSILDLENRKISTFVVTVTDNSMKKSTV